MKKPTENWSHTHAHQTNKQLRMFTRINKRSLPRPAPFQCPPCTTVDKIMSDEDGNNSAIAKQHSHQPRSMSSEPKSFRKTKGRTICWDPDKFSINYIAIQQTINNPHVPTQRLPPPVQKNQIEFWKPKSLLIQHSTPLLHLHLTLRLHLPHLGGLPLRPTVHLILTLH